MEKKKRFDLAGMFIVVNEMNKSFTTPLPSGVERMGFCHFCLGANYPGHMENKKGWCCSSWGDQLLPPLKICEWFQVDRKQVKRIIKVFRPARRSKKVSKRDPIKEIILNIGGVVIKMPIAQ